MSIQNTISDFNTDTQLIQSFLTQIKGFDGNLTFNQQGWTINECLEHILLTEKTRFTIYYVDAPLPEFINNEAFIAGKDKLYHILSKRVERKVDAPPHLKPQSKNSNISEVSDAILINRKKLIHFFESNPNALDNAVYSHPRLGELTKQDWIYFLIYHTQRHLDQIKEILKSHNLSNLDFYYN